VRIRIQRSKSFLDILEQHKKAGFARPRSPKLYRRQDENGNKFPFTTSDLRAIKSRSVNIQKQDQIRTPQKLRTRA
jgi:hypothetical protein